MRRHLGMLVLAVGVATVLLLSTILYTVDELEDIVLIRTFGRITAVKQGSRDAGLNLKWPWPFQRVIRYDSRTSVFEDTSTETQTKDNQNLLVTLYCAWRIADPEKFHRRIEDRDRAQERLRDLLRAAKTATVGKHDMADFVNTDPQAMEIAAIEREIFDKVRRDADEDYGVEIVRVGLKSLNLPEQVTSAVIDSMKEERQAKARDLKSEGDAMAKAIIERARSARKKILKFAERKAEEIRTEGSLAAARYYEKYGKDYKLAMFLRARESARAQLKERSVFLLDGSVQPWVKWLRKPPSLDDLPGEKEAAETQPSTRPAAPPEHAAQETVDTGMALFEDTGPEVFTRDRQAVQLTMYCAWRVEDAAKFQREVKSRDRAAQRLRDLLRDHKARAVARHTLDELIQADPKKARLNELEKEIRDGMADEARRGCGIEIVTVGAKSLTLPRRLVKAVEEALRRQRERSAGAGRPRSTKPTGSGGPKPGEPADR